MGKKNEPLVGPQQSQIGGIESSFFWPTGTSNDVCIRYINGSIYLWICVWILRPGQRWLPFQKLKIKGEGLKIISFGDIEYKLGTYVSRIFVTKILIILICPWYMDYFQRPSNEITQCKILGPIIYFFFGRSLSIQTVLLFGRYLIGIFPWRSCFIKIFVYWPKWEDE